MVSKDKFITLVRESMEEHFSSYGHNKNARLLVLDSYSRFIPGYERLPGSNQIIITHKGKIVYNSDDSLSDEQLLNILLKTIDYKSLKVPKRQWILKVLRVDRRTPTYDYFRRDTRKQAEDDAKYMKTLEYFTEIDLMREKVPYQYLDDGNYDDLIHIKKIK